MKIFLLRCFIKLSGWGMLNWLSTESFIKLEWRLLMKYPLNLKKPRSFNEKLQWLKLHDQNDAYSQMVDKYAVKKYISEIIGEEYVVPLLGKWDKVEDIDFNKLPNQFVLKCTHNSGGVVICKDKYQFNIVNAKKKLKGQMKKDWYWYHRERPYKNIKPCIIAEEFIGINDVVPEDYKVFCANGKPIAIRVDVGRFQNVTYNFYTLDWQRSSIEMGPHSEVLTPRPKCLNEMLELSAKLSSNIKQIRVDWYVVENHLYFGELTFYNAAGFDLDFDYESDLRFGSYFPL